MDETDVRRDAKGRVLPGSVLNPKGRPKKRKGYLDILQSVCTLAKWRQICNKAVAWAMAGDRHARRWLGGYLMGKPIQRVKADVESRSVIDARYVSDIERIYGEAGDAGDSLDDGDGQPSKSETPSKE